MVMIVGAGLVGSLWAVLLRKQGHEVLLFERRSDLRKQQGGAGRSINLVMTSRGLQGLEKAGLLEEGRKLAVPVYGRMIHTKTSDVVYQAYGQSNECNWSISRGELNKFLVNAAEEAGAKIHFEHELQELDPAAKKIVFKTPAGEKSFSYEVLFGADGAGSRVRKELAKKFPQDFTERTDWLEADYKELTLPTKADGTPALRTDALHIWPRGAHMMMGLANLDGSFTATVYLPKTRAPGQEWSFDRLKSSKDTEDLFTSEFPDAIPLMPSYVKEMTDHPQGALGTVRASRWVFADSIAIMGDASHAIVPFFGQGMNSGFEDCTVLLELLQKFSGQWPKILHEFEKRQKPNADAISEMALENWVEMRDKVGDARFLLRKKVESLLEQKHPGLFKSRYGLITYTLTSYEMAKKAGVRQNEMIDSLIEGISSIDEVSWEKAERLLKEEWFPFMKENNFEIRNYP